MEIKRFLRYALVLLVVVVLSTSLTGCFKSASEGVDNGDDQMPVPGEATQPSDIQIAATATAAAQQVQPTTAADTPAVVVVTETPAAQVAQATEQPQATAALLTYVVATPGIPKDYALQKGEFPFCLARRFNVDQYELLNLNGLSLNSNVLIGAVLKIPQTGNTFNGARALVAHPTNYTVKAGDTIYTIACKYGDVSPDMIALQNNLSAPYTLTAKQVLVIP